MSQRLTWAAGIIAALFSLQSCVIEQDYHFNKDFSGTYNTRIDLSSMSALMEGEASMDTLFSEQELQDMSAAYQNVPGITNANTTFENNVLNTGFSFQNLDALHTALKSQETGGNTSFLSFTKKKKKLQVKVNRDFDNEQLNSSESESAGEMISFKINLHFEDKIKKVKGESAEWNKENNSVLLEFSLKDLTDKSKKLDVDIQFK